MKAWWYITGMFGFGLAGAFVSDFITSTDSAWAIILFLLCVLGMGFMFAGAGSTYTNNHDKT